MSRVTSSLSDHPNEKSTTSLSYSAASGKVIPTNDSDKYSVYISIAVPRK